MAKQGADENCFLPIVELPALVHAVEEGDTDTVGVALGFAAVFLPPVRVTPSTVPSRARTAMPMPHWSATLVRRARLRALRSGSFFFCNRQLLQPTFGI